MEKKIEVEITRDEFFDFLKSRGITVPDFATIHAGWDSERVEFPIVVRWNEKATMPFTLVHRLSDSDMQTIKVYVNHEKRIEAIKHVRTVTGWFLKESKDWLDYQFPRSSEKA